MRCAGSADNHRVRISTCPLEGCGIGASFQRNSSPVNLPAERAFKIHWRFLLSVIRYSPLRLSGEWLDGTTFAWAARAGARSLTPLLRTRPNDQLSHCRNALL